MAPEFLNDRLVMTKRFGPRSPVPPTEAGEAGEANEAAEATEASADAAPADAAQAELEKLVRAEEAEARRKVNERDAVETRRRHQEVRAALGETMTRLRERLRDTEQELQALESLRQQLDGAGDAPMTSAQLHELKRAIHQAHMETVRHALSGERRFAEGAATGGGLLGAPLGALTRLGLALTWPLLVALLVCFLGTLLVLVRLFGL